MNSYMLPSHDPYYTKLALFDKFAFHYLNHMSYDIKDNLKKLNLLERKYLNVITDNKKYIPLNYYEGHNIIGFAYEAKK